MDSHIYSSSTNKRFILWLPTYTASAFLPEASGTATPGDKISHTLDQSSDLLRHFRVSIQLLAVQKEKRPQGQA